MRFLDAPVIEEKGIGVDTAPNNDTFKNVIREWAKNRGVNPECVPWYKSTHVLEDGSKVFAMQIYVHAMCLSWDDCLSVMKTIPQPIYEVV